MKQLFFIFLSLVSLSFCHAQDMAVDSKGEPVFQLYSTNELRLQFSRRTPVSASYMLRKKSKNENQFSGMLLQASLLNSGDFPFVEKLKDVRPGAGIKMGYQNSVEQLQLMRPNSSSVHLWGFNIFLNMDNLKLYDTIKGFAEKRYPLTYGAEGNYTLFFKNRKEKTSWRKALSLFASVSSAWNDHNLLSYQEISKITFRPDVIAMQDFDGRYGVLRENFFKYRMAVSFPMFYKWFNPTPYWVAIFGTQNSPSYHMGVFTNILSSSLHKSNTRLPNSFGFGFDWVYATEHLPANVNLFLKLAISLGKLNEE